MRQPPGCTSARLVRLGGGQEERDEFLPRGPLDENLLAVRHDVAKLDFPEEPADRNDVGVEGADDVTVLAIYGAELRELHFFRLRHGARVPIQ